MVFIVCMPLQKGCPRGAVHYLYAPSNRMPQRCSLFVYSPFKKDALEGAKFLLGIALFEQHTGKKWKLRQRDSGDGNLCSHVFQLDQGGLIILQFKIFRLFKWYKSKAHFARSVTRKSVLTCVVGVHRFKTGLPKKTRAFVFSFVSTVF